MTDNEIVKALDRLKATKDYLREQYQERVKSCPYPELKPIAKQTYEDNKKAFNIAIKAIEEFNRQKAKIEALIAGQETLQKYIAEQKAEIERLKTVNDSFADIGKLYSEIKAEAYKEFAERVKDAICENTYPSFDKDGKPVNVWKAKSGYDVIDNLVKEMVGEQV